MSKRRMPQFGSRIENAINKVDGYEPPPDWAKTLATAACWAVTGDSFFPVSEVSSELPAGAYKCMASNQGPYFEKMPIQIDKLLTLPDSAVDKLIDEFKTFWNLKKNFDDRGFTFKRGMLMWGPPGSGKTSAIWQMTKELVEHKNGIVIFIEHPGLATTCLSILRRVEPERPIITVMEDLDALVSQFGDHGFLALLDGETQIANVVHLATTNYPEYLDKRFVDRPSRFDTVMFIDMPSTKAREAYFKAKEPELDGETLQRWVRKSDGFSIAHLREIIIAIKCFNQPENEVFERLNDMQTQLKSDGYRQPIGMTAGHYAAE